MNIVFIYEHQNHMPTSYTDTKIICEHRSNHISTSKSYVNICEIIYEHLLRSYMNIVFTAYDDHI